MTMKSKPSRAAISASILVCLLVLVSIVPLGAVAQSGGESEPNDARAAATPIEDSVSGEIVVKGGVDWYSVQATEGEVVSFLVTKSDSEPQLEVFLYGPEGNELSVDYEAQNDSRNQVATIAEQTGKYYVKIKAANNSKTKIPYTVSGFSHAAGTEASAYQEGEPNDARAAATSLGDTYSKSRYDSSGDTDWYAARFTKGETVSFILSDKSTDTVSLQMEIYSPNGTELQFTQVYGDDSRAQIAVIAKQTGTYYVEVKWLYEGNKLKSPFSYKMRAPGGEPPVDTSLSTTTASATATQTAATPSTQTVTASQMTATSTPTTNTEMTTQTEASTNTGTTGSANTPAEEETTSMFGPGFTSVGAIIALLSAGLFAFRRR
jgi:PGF-CTERM protein